VVLGLQKLSSQLLVHVQTVVPKPTTVNMYELLMRLLKSTMCVGCSTQSEALAGLSKYAVFTSKECTLAQHLIMQSYAA
jgi:hypothetical protein